MNKKSRLHYTRGNGNLKTVGYILPILFFVFVANIGCKHDHFPSLSTGGHDYVRVNLVSDTSGYNAARIDTNLDNPWGIAIGPTGIFWLAVNHNGSSAVYDANGGQVLPNVDVPLPDVTDASSPDGVIYNNTSSFIVNGQPAKFLFSTEDGIIAEWNGSDTTVTVVDRSAAGAVYKGLAIANDGTGDFIYITDFFNDRIDVYNQSFIQVSDKLFADPSIPAGFAPFNIRNIGGRLYVTYAKQLGPDNHDDQSGSGNGYVNIFNPDGTLVKRFTSQGTLNSPWGIIQAPASFGQGDNVILIANFGDGAINIFDSTGTYKGQIENNSIPLLIDGLWDIAFITGSNQLYFTAGPQLESYGVFGYLKMR